MMAHSAEKSREFFFGESSFLFVLGKSGGDDGESKVVVDVNVGKGGVVLISRGYAWFG